MKVTNCEKTVTENLNSLVKEIKLPKYRRIVSIKSPELMIEESLLAGRQLEHKLGFTVHDM